MTQIVSSAGSCALRADVSVAVARAPQGPSLVDVIMRIASDGASELVATHGSAALNAAAIGGAAEPGVPLQHGTSFGCCEKPVSQITRRVT